MAIEDYCNVVNGELVLRGGLQQYFRGNIFSCDPAIHTQLDMLDRLGNALVPLIVDGEVGCSKDSIVRYAHASSSRGKKPLFKINCAYLPEGVAVNELFGYGKGNTGLLHSAAGCSLYIENISLLSVQTQYRLAEYILANKESPERVRYMISLSDTPNPQNGLIKPLLQYFDAMTFRIPPLRERKDDILLATIHQLHQIRKSYRIERTISPDLMTALMSYDWPGNTQQLCKVVDRMAFMSDKTLLDSVQLLEKSLSAHGELQQEQIHVTQPPHSKTLKELVLDYEVMIINQYIEQYGSIRKAAAALGVTHAALSIKLTKYNSASPAKNDVYLVDMLEEKSSI